MTLSIWGGFKFAVGLYLGWFTVSVAFVLLTVALRWVARKLDPLGSALRDLADKCGRGER